MPGITLFDDPSIRLQLLPFTYTRPVAEIRCGIRRISEKWNDWLHTQVTYQTAQHLALLFPIHPAGDIIYINGAICPDQALVSLIQQLPAEAVITSENGEILAVRTTSHWNPAQSVEGLTSFKFSNTITIVRNLWDIFTFNGAEIIADFARITAFRKSQPLTDSFTHCYAPENIFIEEGAVLKASVLNAENGPIYIGKNTLVQEGSLIQGPFALGESSVLAQGTKIRPNTSIGPHCKVGGEVSNSIFFGYSNKGHDGYLGNSVLGEWCNLGANTNNSNLKNDHSPVKIHSYTSNSLENTGLLFCGLFMGDYSKAGISTMFNTGTVVGIHVNVFGAGFQPKHIPSFSWGGAAEGFSEYRLDKAIQVTRDTITRKQMDFSETDEQMLTYLFKLTQNQRDQFC